MEEYVNENTIIKDDVYEKFRDAITCSICQHLMIYPVMCMNCMNIYCKKCGGNFDDDCRDCKDWDKKFQLDLEYVNNLTFMMDMKVIFKTIKVVLCREGINQEGQATMTSLIEYRKGSGKNVEHK